MEFLRAVFSMRYVIIVVAIAIAITTSTITYPDAAVAQAAGPAQVSCGKATGPAYMGAASIPADSYDVYARLGAVSKVASASVYAQPSGENGECHVIASGEITSDAWRKLGEVTIRTDERTVFHVSSPALEGVPDANRPSLMLISRTNPVCAPEAECIVEVQGQRAIIRPTNLTGNDPLRVMVAENLSSADIKEVRYYVDNELFYTSASLEPFRPHAIPYYASRLIRVVEYSSGQTAIIEQPVSGDRSIGLVELLFAPMYKYRNILLILGGIVGVFVGYYLLRFAASAYLSRREWRINHGFISGNAALPFAERYPRLFKISSTINQAASKIAIAVSALVIIVVLGIGTTIYIVQIATIQGGSMEMSYKPEQKVFVQKTSVTLARLNKTDFIPARGQVVVAHPSFGNATDVSVAEQDTVVKRVIGLPGERIVIEGDTVMIYNDAYPKGFNPEKGAPWAENIVYGNTVGRIELHLGERQLFIIGDNRPVSTDSRYYGPIEATQIIGTVL